MKATMGQIESTQNAGHDCKALKEMGDCHTALANYQEAERLYKQASFLAPDEADPLVGLGAVALQQGRFKQAERAFRLALSRDERSAAACSGLAMVLQERKDYARAFDMYLKSLDMEPDNLLALLGLFQTSCQMGTFSKIIHYLEVYLSSKPGDVSILFCLGSLYAREGRLGQARRTLMTVLSLEPDKTEAAAMLADVERAIGLACHSGAPAYE